MPMLDLKPTGKWTKKDFTWPELVKMMNHSEIGERFENNVAVEEGTGCWLWIPSIEKGVGYGTMSMGGYTWQAHRFSWMMHRGEIPEGMLVCHKCDVPACVNPDHLFLGTAQDNARDMVEKGRHPGGNRRNTKLTAEQVAQLRTDRSKDFKEWAKEFGVTPSATHAALYGRTWKTMIDPPPLKIPERRYPTDWEATGAECLERVKEFDAMVAATVGKKSLFR